MASRSRSRDGEARRRYTSRRGVGVWNVAKPAFRRREASTVAHGESRSRGLVSWRAFSALIVVSLSTVLLLFFNADAFYVHSVAVGGLEDMTKEEVFALTDIADMHIFWVEPETVRQSLLRSPTIADAEVRVGWPPNLVQVIIQERQPAIIWEQNGVATWIDLQGRVMRLRNDRDDLLRVSSDHNEPLGSDVQISVDVVAGALQLQSMYPNIDSLRYEPENGLGYADGRGWVVWFGVGTDMPEKILIYNTIVDDLLARGIQPGEINISNPDAPYYSVLWGR